jgi:hypothetical protein
MSHQLRFAWLSTRKYVPRFGGQHACGSIAPHPRLQIEPLEERCLLAGDSLDFTADLISARAPASEANFNRQEVVIGGFRLTTTGSDEPVYHLDSSDAGGGSLVESGALINLDAFRSDSRFAGIDGSGFASVIIDSGIDLNHPFFGPDADFNGIADRIVYQYDFSGSNDADATDFANHGTHVASIVASQDTTYSGMAPASDIIALKVFPDAGLANNGDIEEALQWVVANAATYNIASVNMSLGALANFDVPFSFDPLSDELAALAALDVIVVSAAGNNYYQVQAPGVSYPAADPNSLAVSGVWDGNFGTIQWIDGATDYTTGPDRFLSISQRDGSVTDIVAPGALITAADNNGGTIAQGGTSMAAPHVAGMATLAQELAVQTLGRRLSMSEFTALVHSTGVTIFDGDDEDDNVTNTLQSYRRADMLALGEAILEISEFYSEDLSASPGWSATGEWAFGQPTGEGAEFFGKPDPTSGATGANVYGINLNGDFTTAVGGPSYLTTTAIDTTGYTNVILGFQRWLNIDWYFFSNATIDVSNDGTTWTTVYTNPLGETIDNAWQDVWYDISSVADNQATVYIRWSHEIVDSLSYPYSGWNIDDITLSGIPIAAPPVVSIDSLLTNDSTPQLTGRVDDPDATISVDVGEQLGLAATNNGDGTWTLADNLLAALTDGTYDVVVRATNGDLLVGVDATVDELTIDTVAPIVAVNPLSTSDSTPELTGTVDDYSATIRVDVGMQLDLVAINNGDGTWTLPDNVLAALADGTYDVVVRATDAATNVGLDATTAELTVDVPLVGDYNEDNSVDAADYILFRMFQGTNTQLPNDPNGPPVDQRHYDQWAANFGATESGGGSETNAVEPPARSDAVEPLVLTALAVPPVAPQAGTRSVASLAKEESAPIDDWFAAALPHSTLLPPRVGLRTWDRTALVAGLRDDTLLGWFASRRAAFDAGNGEMFALGDFELRSDRDVPTEIDAVFEELELCSEASRLPC